MTADYEVDVAVVGAGACGMLAALKAAEAGARSVGIFEKSTRAGCNTEFSSGSLAAAGTRWQREAGVADDPGRYADDILQVSGDRGSADMVRKLCGVAPQYVEWLADELGYPIELGLDMPRAGHSVPRLHTDTGRIGGRRLIQCLRQVADRSQTIALVDNTPAIGLLGDADGVTGLRVSEPEGVKIVRAGVTVLAADGFGASASMLADHCPEAAGRIYGGVSTSTGDAIRWGMELGAGVANMASFLGHGMMVPGYGTRLSPSLPFLGAIIVDRSGNRFLDETAQGYSKLASLLAAREDGPALMIWDEEALAGCRESELMRDSERAGAFRRYEDASQLHSGTGVAVDPDRLEMPVRRLTPPYYAAWVSPGMLTTQGGLVVDLEGRVQSRAGGPIPGLYAGGGSAAGISGPSSDGYTSGNGLLAALGMGWIIGCQLGARP